MKSPERDAGFEFDDEDDENRIRELGRQLQSDSLNAKSAKALAEIGPILECVPQCSDRKRNATEPLARALIRESVIRNPDKEIRVHAAFALAQVLKIFAPEAPYSDEELKDVFGTISSAFGELKSSTGPNFQTSLRLLEVMKQVKFGLLLLDIDFPNTLCKLFNTFFHVINAENYKRLEPPMLEVMVTILQELDIFSEQVVETVMQPLTQNNQASARLARKALAEAKSSISRYVHKYVENKLSNWPQEKSGLPKWCQKIVRELNDTFEVASCVIVPHLLDMISGQKSGRRFQGVDAVGDILTDAQGIGPLSPKDRQNLGNELTTRFMDVNAQVRQRALAIVPDLVALFHESEQKTEVLSCASDCLGDAEWKVRSTVVSAICKTAISEPESIREKVLDSVLGRLRDAKQSVRKSTAQSLIEVIQGVMQKDGFDFESSVFIKAFGPLFMFSTIDPELSQHHLRLLSQKDLFPPRSCPRQCARSWVYIYAGMDANQKTALCQLMHRKATIQNSLKGIIQSGRLLCSCQNESAKKLHLKRIEQYVSVVAPLCPSSEKAKSAFQSMLEIKNERTYDLMEAFLGLKDTDEDISAVKKRFLEKIGPKNGLADVLKLASKLGKPTVITPGHMSALITMLKEDSLDDFEASHALEIMKLVAKWSSDVLCQSGNAILSALTTGCPKFQTDLAYVLAKSAKAIKNRRKSKEQEKKVMDVLLGVARAGPPQASKYVVLSLKEFLEKDKAEQVFRELCNDCMGKVSSRNFEQDPSALTTVQVLSSIGRAQPDVLAENAEDFSNFVLNGYMHAPLDPLDNFADPTFASCSPGMPQKCEALQALAKAVSSDALQKQTVPDSFISVAKNMFDMINTQGMLEPDSELSLLGVFLDNDHGPLRLAALKATIALCNHHDQLMPNDLYKSFALMVQDPLMDLRAKTTQKLKKHIQKLQAARKLHKTQKYAACLALAGLDPNKDNCEVAQQVLCSYIQQQRQCVEAEGKLGANWQPEFLVPYLVYLLANHVDMVRVFDEDDPQERCNTFKQLQQILQFGLEPFLVGDFSKPSSYALICALLRCLKVAQDIEDRTATGRILAVSDMALEVVKRTVNAACVLGATRPSDKYNGSAPFPKKLFTRGIKQGIPKDGLHLPRDFQPIEIALTGKPCVLKEHEVGKNKRGRPKKQAKEDERRVDKGVELSGWQGNSESGGGEGAQQSSGHLGVGDENVTGSAAHNSPCITNDEMDGQFATAGTKKQKKLRDYGIGGENLTASTSKATSHTNQDTEFSMQTPSKRDSEEDPGNSTRGKQKRQRTLQGYYKTPQQGKVKRLPDRRGKRHRND